MNILHDKTIVLCITGSIAAFKGAALASRFFQDGARVHVAMTRAATNFVSPLTFESLTHRPVVQNVLALGPDSEIEHVTLAKRADVVLIAPATANTLARLAHGLADDAVSAIALDTPAPIVVAPAMETGMWENPATRDNIATLRRRGVIVIEPASGHLASGASGKGRLADEDQILGTVRMVLGREGPLSGHRLVITSGGTHEPIDPVRVITNRSSGKTGYALAQEALDRGASVTFITTQREGPFPVGADCVYAATTNELHAAVMESVRRADALIMAAAPSDYRVRAAFESKIKKEEAEALTLDLVRNADILGDVARLRKEQPGIPLRVVVGFAAETNDLVENARSKLERKHLDLVVANPVPQTFGSDRVQATLLQATGEIAELEPMPKEDLASLIFDRVQALLA